MIRLQEKHSPTGQPAHISSSLEMISSFSFEIDFIVEPISKRFLTGSLNP